MNEGNPPTSEGSKKSEGPSRKSFFERLGQLFQGEVKDRQELVDVIRDSEINDLIDHDTRDMLEGVMEISEMRVRDIMLPRSQMVTVERTDDLDTLIALITDAQHSRYPVISEDKDHVEGILLAKDLLKYLGSESAPFDIEQVIRPVVVVPESKRVDRLLKEFQEERYHMSIVVDEFGGVSGLVTIEDILEEIVGEITDEFDAETEHQVTATGDGEFMVDGATTIRDLNRANDWNLPDEEANTIAGLVIHEAQMIPTVGQVFSFHGFRFEVIEREGNRITELKIRPL